MVIIMIQFISGQNFSSQLDKPHVRRDEVSKKLAALGRLC